MPLIHTRTRIPSAPSRKQHARFVALERSHANLSSVRFQHAPCCSDARFGKLIVKPSKDSAANETVYDSVERPNDDFCNAASCMVAGIDRRHCLEELLT